MEEGKESLEEQLFAALLDCSDPARRREILDQQCNGDEALKRRVEALLEADTPTNKWLQRDQDTVAELSTLAKDSLDFDLRRGIDDFDGRFRLLESIGEGGFGAVYRAEQLFPVRREVALKLIKPGMDSRRVVARFEQERQTLAMMDHPNIARVLDAGSTVFGRPYFVMEYVAGKRITHHCDECRLGVQDRLRLMIQVCHAIQHAHQKGVIHRDIKPSNVLVAVHDGVVVPKVIDFGIAKAFAGVEEEGTVFTETNQFVGTPNYMSPEQASLRTGDIDTRCDVYSLGVLLYELLTGRTPFESLGSSAMDPELIRESIREREAAPPSARLRLMAPKDMEMVADSRGVTPEELQATIRGDLDWIILKCLEKDRNRRYETANGLAMDLMRHLGNEPVVARPPSTFYKIDKFARRNRLAFISGTVVTLALVAGTVISTSQAIRARRAEAAQRLLLEEARESKAKAEAAEKEARQREAESLRSLYIANINLAQRHWESGDLDRLRELLHITREDPHRGFEWFFLAHAANLDLRTVRTSLLDIRSTAISPDGRFGAFGSSGGGVEICDLSTTNRTRLREVGPSPVHTLAFSGDSRSLASLDELGHVQFFNTESRALETSFKVNKSPRAAAFSPDNSLMALGAEDGMIELVDVRLGQVTHSFKGHSDWVFGVAFTPDGKRLMTGSWDKTIKVWDTTTWQFLETLPGHRAGVLSVQYSPDGRQVLSGGFGAELHLWDSAHSKLSGSFVGHTDLVRSVAFLPDGKRMVSGGGDRALRLWDVSTKKLLLSLPGHGGEIDSLRSLPSGRVEVISGSQDGSIKLWNFQEAVEVPQFGRSEKESGYANWQTFTGVSPDGRRIVHGKQENPPEVFDGSSFERQGRFLGHELNFVSSVAFAPDNTRVLTGSHDTTGRIWDTTTMKELAVLEGHSHYVSSVAWSAQANWVVTGSLDTTARVWQADSGHAAATLRGHSRAVRCVAISSSARWVATGSEDGTIRLWDRELAQTTRVLTATNAWFPSVAISSDETRLLGGQSDGVVRMWELTTGRELLRISTPFAVVWHVGFSPDGRRFSTSGYARAAQVRESDSGHEVLVLRAGSASIRNVYFTGDGSRIVASCSDGSCRIWRGITPERLASWFNH